MEALQHIKGTETCNVITKKKKEENIQQIEEIGCFGHDYNLILFQFFFC